MEIKFLKLISIIIFTTGIFYCTPKEKKLQRPNILFIMSDDHATQAISAYGSKINKTPNIDRIAKEGMIFRNCFCTNSICAPSRAVILTGKYSHLNGVVDNAKEFDGSQQTVSKLFREAGYETAMIGKWHLKSAPTGFDYYNVLPGQGVYYDPAMIENGEKHNNKGYVTDILTDKALEWLNRWKSSNSGKPFFMMLHHKAPHANWEPAEEKMDMYNDRDIPLPVTFNDNYETRTNQIRNSKLHVGPFLWNLHFKRYGELPGVMTEQETREWVYQKYMKHYLGCISSVDDNVGRVLDYLDKSGLSNNTFIVYTSDQGFFLGEHGLYDKRFMYEEALRMPLLIRYPGIIPAGDVSDAMVLNLDFMPTFLDFASISKPEDLQGISFKSIAIGSEPEEWRNAIFYKFYEEAYGIGPHEGVRTDRYKLIHFLYGDEGWELYDLKEDPNELNNLYSSPDHQELIGKLKEKLDSLRRQYRIEG
jgi:arylsulfatase A-like enzyme